MYGRKVCPPVRVDNSLKPPLLANKTSGIVKDVGTRIGKNTGVWVPDLEIEKVRAT